MGRESGLITVAGAFIALASLSAALLLEGGQFADLVQGTAALVVFGGVAGAILIATPTRVLLACVQETRSVFVNKIADPATSLQTIIRMAEHTRRFGLSGLERAALSVTDPFLNKGLNLVADGTPATQVREMLRLEVIAQECRFTEAAGVWESAAGYAPTLGIIGAVLALIQVMKHVDNLDGVGRGIAVAFVATIYGLVAANLLFLPIAARLRVRERELLNLHEMMLEGCIAIGEGLNPSMIRLKLNPLSAGDKVARAATSKDPENRSFRHVPSFEAGS